MTLDVNDLSARGYLQGAYQWADATGNAVFLISLRCQARQLLHLSWRIALLEAAVISGIGSGRESRMASEIAAVEMEHETT